MTFWQRLLTYYLTSYRYFTDKADFFWESNGLCGTCGRACPHFRNEPCNLECDVFPSGTKADAYGRRCGCFPFEAKVYRENKKRGEYYLDKSVRLTDETIKDYFENVEDEDILFFLLFAHWIGLPEAKIRQIRVCRTRETAEQILLNNITKENDVYYVALGDGKEIEALRNGMLLTAADDTTFEVN